jgi:hypothetical protein
MAEFVARWEGMTFGKAQCSSKVQLGELQDSRGSEYKELKGFLY